MSRISQLRIFNWSSETYVVAISCGSLVDTVDEEHLAVGEEDEVAHDSAIWEIIVLREGVVDIGGDAHARSRGGHVDDLGLRKGSVLRFSSSW